MFRFLLVLSFAISQLLAVENTMGTFGYGRVQTSLQNNKENVCFKAPGAGSKYRLGNECETWIELGITQDLKLDNGLHIHNQVRPIFMGANNKAIDLYDWAELYTEVSNIFDDSTSFWIGRKFYQRYDSHMTDYWFLNMSGDGMGVSNVDLGEVSLSYAILFERLNPTVDTSDKNALFISHDLRFLKKTYQGELTLFLNYMTINGENFDAYHKVDAVDGYAVGLLYKDTTIFQKWFNMKGENISGIFYGSGLSKGAGEYVPYLTKEFENSALIDNLVNSGTSIESAKTWRFINNNFFENDTFGIMSNFVYEYTDEKEFSNLEQDWISAGIRPYWFINKYARLVLETGYDYVNNRVDKKTYALLKTTIAAELSTDKGIWTRPVLRLYYTNATWSNDAVGSVGTDYYSNKSRGDNVGVQLEYWW